MEKEFVYDKDKLPRPIISGHDDFIELYYKAWELAFSNVVTINCGKPRTCLSCMPQWKRIWVWDSCFMTFITNYSNGTITALNNLDVLYDMQRESDGYIGQAYDYDSLRVLFGNRINPPLFAWAEWNYYLISGDSSRFERVIPKIEALFSFIENNRRRERGLYWFNDHGASGMDNSPRGPFPAKNQDGSDMCHIDLASQQALTAKCLYDMFSVMNNGEKADFYNSEYKRICNLINEYHWHEGTGFYYDFFDNNEFLERKIKYLNTKTLAAAWTMTAMVAESDKLKKLCKHFLNPDEFYTKIPFASLSKDDINYDSSGGYWMGGVWAPTNYALIRGLKDNGFESQAREAVIKYLTGMYKVYRDCEFGTIWETYAPESYMPALRENGERVRKDFVGWSGIGPVAMLIENVIGLGFDAKSNTVTFNISDYNESGIENLLFNGGYISVVCREYKHISGGSKIIVECEKPFTLIVKTEYNSEDKVIEVKTGKNEFFV